MAVLRRFCCFSLCVAVGLGSFLVGMGGNGFNVAFAQDNVAQASGGVDVKKEAGDSAAPQKQRYDLDHFPSLFFTYWQHQAILDVKNSRVVRPLTDAQLRALGNGDSEFMPKKPEPGDREIRLGGIVYKGKDDWTIWMNGKRIKPDAVPEEILDLRVYPDYIEVKWLDKFTNKIYPVRLRAHERFNMDMRIFLPD